MARDRALSILVSHSILFAIIYLPGVLKTPLELISQYLLDTHKEKKIRAPEEPCEGHKADTGKAILFSRSFDWRAKLPEMGSSARLFLWVHWWQAEAGVRLSLTDQEIAEALNVDIRTIQTWKQSLVRTGHLEISEAEDQGSFWSDIYAGLKKGGT